METRTDEDIVPAFDRLSLTGKEKFTRLHEGKWEHPTKIQRIHRVCTCLCEGDSPSLSFPLNVSQTNCFTDLDGKRSHIYLLVSKINHSCLPNASFHTLLDGLTYPVALKPILSGKEVFITCGYDLEGNTRKERRLFLSSWHFTFACDCCMADARSEAVSNARRRITSIVYSFAEAEATDTADEVAEDMLLEAYKKMKPGATRYETRQCDKYVLLLVSQSSRK